MVLNIVLFSGFAGITVFIGGLLANYFNHHIKESPVKYEIIHTLMSFGSGIMLSAIALVLIPAGMEDLELLPMAISFLAAARALRQAWWLYRFSHATGFHELPSGNCLKLELVMYSSER